MLLAGAAPQVLGTLGSLQQALAGASSAPASAGSFGLHALGQNSGATNGTPSKPATSVSGTASQRPSAGTMAALLAAQGAGNTGDNGVAAVTAPPANAHRRPSFHSPPGGNLSILA